MTLLLRAVFVLIAVAIAIAEWRWITRKSSRLGLIVAIGTGTRLIAGVTSFAISYFDVPILRGLHAGDGFWTLALDAKLYYGIASTAASSPFSISWSSTSPAYTIALAWWLHATGVSVMSAIVFNVACYLATAAAIVAGTQTRERRPSDAWVWIVLAAFTFSPLLLLASTQVLKDPFFSMLIALSCRAGFAMFEALKRDTAQSRVKLIAACGAVAVLVVVITGVRPYFGAIWCAAFAAGFGALVVVGPGSTMPRARRALVGLTLLAGVWTAFAIGSGPYYSYYQRAISGSGLTGQIETSRESFVQTGGATNMALPSGAVPAPTVPGPAGAPATPASGAAPPAAKSAGAAPSTVRKLMTGLLAIFVPMSLLKAASIVTFAGGRGLIFVADADTLFLDGSLILLALMIVRRRPPLISNTPAVTFAVTLLAIATGLLAYVVTNFGTLLRLRLFVAATAWVGTLAFFPSLAGHALAPAAAIAGRRPNDRAAAALGVIALLALILAPGAPDSMFSGTPLTKAALAWVTGSCLMLALIVIVRPRRQMGPGWIAAVVALAMLKGALAFDIAPSGWRGTYQVLDTPQARPIEFGFGLARTPYRIDRSIDVEGAKSNLPRELPLLVGWTGFVDVAASGPLVWSVRCRGAISIDVDGIRQTTVRVCADGPFPVTTPLTKGGHTVYVRYRKPAGAIPLAVFVPAGAESGATLGVSVGANLRSLWLTRLTTIAGWSGGVLLLLAIARIYWPDAATGGIRGWPSRAAALAVFALLLALSYRAAMTFSGLTAQPSADARAQAFDNQAIDVISGTSGGFHSVHSLYVYALAATHLLLGEDLTGPVLLNLVCLSALIPIGWWVGWRHLKNMAAIAAPVAMGLFIGWYAWRIATPTTDESFFMALAWLALGASLRALRSGTAKHWGAALLCVAAAIATRPGFVMYPLILGSLLVWRRRQPAAVSFGRFPPTLVLGVSAFVASQLAMPIAGLASVLLGVTLLLPRRESVASADGGIVASGALMD